jgi:hypothetical protein
MKETRKLARDAGRKPRLEGPALLVVGNGLAIDLTKERPGLEEWHPSQPLAWDVPNPCAPARQLIQDLPAAAAAIATVRAASTDPALADFAVFDRLEHVVTSSDRLETYCQLRHYLGLAYSAYQERADAVVADPAWSLGSFVGALAGDALGVISYNYDLTVERIVGARGLSLHHLGLPGGGVGLPLFKPHGSIDYTLGKHVFGGKKPSYPLWLTADLNDAPMRLLETSELRLPRYEVDVVLPAERSKYHGFQWVQPGWAWVQNEAKKARTIVYLGLSYWPCDREELKVIVAATDGRSRCIVVNPEPPPEFMALVKGHYAEVDHWVDADSALLT